VLSPGFCAIGYTGPRRKRTLLKNFSPVLPSENSMTVPVNLTYPDAAKARTWSKAKTTADKAGPRTAKTGLGAALTAAEAAWKKVPFSALDARSVKGTSSAELEKATAKAESALTKAAEQARVITQARDKAKQVKTLAPLSSAAKATAAKAEEALTKLVQDLDSLSLSDFKALRPIAMVRDSHAQARLEGKLDWKFEPTDEVIAQLAKVSSETAEYKKFADAFTELAKKYHFTNYNTVPVTIWRDMLKGLAKSGYIVGKVPHAATREEFILGFKGPGGKVIREPMLKQAMVGMNKFTAHAARYLDKVVEEVRKNGGNTWAFWSGVGAQAAAKREVSTGVVLEGSVGAWFEKVYNFEPLTGVSNIVLWTSLSELYAAKAAEYYQHFHYVGFVGPTATRKQSVFRQIEQPTFIKILTEQQKVPAPTVRWYVVDCIADPKAKSGWSPTGKDSILMSDRKAAIAEVKNRYGS
jgi:hypothetical protein